MPEPITIRVRRRVRAAEAEVREILERLQSETGLAVDGVEVDYSEVRSPSGISRGIGEVRIAVDLG